MAKQLPEIAGVRADDETVWVVIDETDALRRSPDLRAALAELINDLVRTCRKADLTPGLGIPKEGTPS